MVEVALGFVIAATIGLTGVGGGVLTVPILILFLNVPAGRAVGTALAFSALVKLPACYVYVRQKQIDYRVFRAMLLGGVPGVVLGSLLLSHLEDGGLRNLVLVLVGLTIAAIAVLNLVRLLNGPEDQRPTHPERLRFLPIFTFLIGLEVGFSSAGAGALGTLVLFGFTRLPAAAIVGTDLLFGLALSTLGGGIHLGLGAWDPDLFGKLVLGGVPGALLGARLATVLPTRLLRGALLVWLTYLGSELLRRGISAVLR